MNTLTRIFLLLILLCAAPASHAATRMVFPGGWYGEAGVNGGYVVLIGHSHLETTGARRVELPTPRQNVLYPRLSFDEMAFAGQGQADGAAWLWRNGWSIVGTTHGVSPVIFDRTNTLRLATLAHGSQGFRFVDENNRIWTGDETYADRDAQLWEWTRRGNIQCGQGAHVGLQCLIDGRRVLVAPGSPFFPRFNRDGNKLAFSWTISELPAVTLLWMTVEELAALPTYVPDTPVEPVEVCGDGIDNDRDGAIDEGCPPPQVVPDLTDAQFATLVRVRAEYPADIALTPEQIGAILNKTAWIHRNDPTPLRLQAKPSGTAAVQPRTGTRIWNGIRLITLDGSHWGGDICGGCSVGRFTPQRATFGKADRDSVVEPVDPGGIVIDPPPPPPPDVEKRVKALEDRITELERILIAHWEFMGATRGQVLDHEHRIHALEQQKPTTSLDEARVRAILEEAIAQLRVRGQTSRDSFGRRLSIDLPVVTVR